MPLPTTLLLLALTTQLAPRQQGPSHSTPSSGDTAGYWQQRVRYEIVATLDETRKDGVLRAAGTLTYVNASPDTLRELYLHQHLNAFRPGSRWSAADEREGRERFERLRDPEFAYERFAAAPEVDGTPVRAEYPGAPDSTVVRLALPRPLRPGDSVRVAMRWDARLSTVPRRQARLGRGFDFAHWYPRVAVYDRGGWQPNALEPAGEFYGEFGEYDVTLVLAPDQVVGATGVPVDGDPGWEGARRFGAARLARDAYGPPAAEPPLPEPVARPAGYRAVRFRARDVHHFAWSVSPDYRYEGGVYVRPAPAAAARFRPFDTVSVHVLYQPGDTSTWGGGLVVERTARALGWLEGMYGPYAHPQMTVLHRIDPGGSEYPMLQMNGSPSYGLNLHEGGHNFVQGTLANNEWQAAWMDEALTDYLSRWAQDLTRHDRARLGSWPPPAAGDAAAQRGYYARAVIPTADDLTPLEQYRLDLIGRAEPVGTPADEFQEYRIYTLMTAGRGAMMMGALRDVLGDSAFVAFLRDYYARWALRHVDEPALRAAAERAHGRELGWFFDQWLRRTGLIDYELTEVGGGPTADGGWLTRARVTRVGDYRHPIPVGVRTSSGWVVRRADPLLDDQTVELRTPERPVEVRLDPYRVTDDWYRPNDAARDLRGWRAGRTVFDWPLLEQYLPDRQVVALAPLAWYSDAGGLTVAARARSNYQRVTDRQELGVAVSGRIPHRRCVPQGDLVELCSVGSPWHHRIHGWYVVDEPLVGRRNRPAVGVRLGVWRLDGLTKLEARRRWDASRFLFAPAGRDQEWSLGYTSTWSHDRAFVEPSRWSGSGVHDLALGFASRAAGGRGISVRGEARGGVVRRLRFDDEDDLTFYGLGYGRVEGSLAHRGAYRDGAALTTLRLFGAWSHRAPPERAIHASARTPTETFGNHLLRARGAPLADERAHYTPLGGAGLRGYAADVRLDRVSAVNAEAALRLTRLRFVPGSPGVYASAFGDAGTSFRRRVLGDAGVGLSLRGRVYDRELHLRLDAPLYVRDPGSSVSSGGRARRAAVALRWVVATGEPAAF